MENLVILSKREEEYLVRALEAGVQVRKLRQFFLWTQGQFQSLLPHEIMVCIMFSENDEVQHIECMHSMVYDPGLIKNLCDTGNGLAVRLARYCRTDQLLPCVIEQVDRDEQHPLTSFRTEINDCKLGKAVVHGTERLQGGSTFFALFFMSDHPTVRQAFFLDLLLPSLHLAFSRVTTSLKDRGSEDNIPAKASAPVQEPMLLLTERQIEVLGWVAKGKGNYEIGVILGINTVTIKNHMQKIYARLNVHNRAEAVSRFHELQLFDYPISEARNEADDELSR